MFPEFRHLGKAESVWIDTTPSTHYPSLSSIPDVDVIVIGAGIAGLTTAYLLQTSGMNVVVLEMQQIVKGVTGYTTAKVTSLHNLIYDHLIHTFGEEQARMYGEANQAGLEKIAELAESLHISCDFLRTSSYTFTESEREIKKIETEVEAAIKLGLPAAFVTETELPLPVKAAVTFRNQAQFHPRKYLLGLAEAFVNAGGHILEYTRVLEVEEGKPCRVTTNRGMISAPHVVVATHFPVYDPAFYFTRLAPYRSCVVGVKLDIPAPRGMYIGVEEEAYSFRNQPTPDGEILIVGGEGYKTGQGGSVREHFERLEAYARQHFPVTATAYHWATQDQRTLDHVPYIGLISPSSKNVYVATGFNGWGMTNGTAAGIILSDLISGRENAWSVVFNPNRFKPLASSKQLISEGANIAKEIVTGHLPKSAPQVLQELAIGDGKVVQHNGEKIAVSKDVSGKLHMVSALCSHMGCVVNWNNAEMSWDCPCHGSRFDADGKVLHGPAVKDLEAKLISSADMEANSGT
jgi:glycine/D-amino acid oxidase-like deaminating enzyme/nitrite reductase/ring-hydroxylating ferredoxin subunit